MDVEKCFEILKKEVEVYFEEQNSKRKDGKYMFKNSGKNCCGIRKQKKSIVIEINSPITNFKDSKLNWKHSKLYAGNSSILTIKSLEEIKEVVRCVENVYN